MDLSPTPMELEPVKSKNILLPMARRGNGSKGQKIHLLTKHFRANFSKPNSHQYFFHYSVTITYEDGSLMEAKGIGRKILEKVQETYQIDLGFKHFAYDGDKNLFTVGPLPSNDAKYFANIGEGVNCCRGFHSSFRTTQEGLSLNIDVSTTMIVQPGPVIDFLIANQNVKDPFSMDWNKAKRTLKNLRVKVIPSNRECKITGLSGLRCKDQAFTLRQKKENGEVEEVGITVFDYFTKVREMKLRYSCRNSITTIWAN